MIKHKKSGGLVRASARAKSNNSPRKLPGRFTTRKNHADDAAACVVCGCTDDNPCDGGCAWAQQNPPVCTRCAEGEPFQFGENSELIFPPGGEGDMGERPTLAIEEDNLAFDVLEMLNQAFALGRRAGVATLDISALQEAGTEMANLIDDLGPRPVARKWRRAMVALTQAEAKALAPTKPKTKRRAR